MQKQCKIITHTNAASGVNMVENISATTLKNQANLMNIALNIETVFEIQS